MGILKVLKNTSWPTPKQLFKDYASILQYTAFFALIIFIFDTLISRGLLDLLKRF